ncbi:MAG: hypothetical protein Q7T11_00305 [Deltaproteobacteria bacterium]|nr:hypothetical protein [Deltaproteobacteria bacterium]
MTDPLKPIGPGATPEIAPSFPPPSRGGPFAELTAPGAPEALIRGQGEGGGPDTARDAAAGLAAIGQPASPAIPKNLGKKEVEQWVEAILPPQFKRHHKEIYREVMGKQPQERGAHLVPIVLRHLLPYFLADEKYRATLIEALGQVLDPKQPHNLLEFNRRLVIEQAASFMAGWNPAAVRQILESKPVRDNA